MTTRHEQRLPVRHFGVPFTFVTPLPKQFLPGPLATPAGWVPNSATIADDGAKKSVTIRATNSSQFFRLRRP